MPADSPRNAIARQWELLRCLPSSAPGKRAADLQIQLVGAGYRVTKRTIERDLEALASMFPITHGASVPYDWHWMKGGAFGLLGLSTTDALSLHLVERYLQPILPDAIRAQLKSAFDLAAAKLAAQKTSNPLGDWPSKVAVVNTGLTVVPAPIDATALRVVQEALLAGEQVEVEYIRADAEVPKTQTLHPLGLVLCGPTTYLIATAFRHATPRIYAMHRVRAARRLYAPASSPMGFSLRAYIDEGGLQFGDGRRIRLQAWVSQRLGAVMADAKLEPRQRLEPVDGGFLLRATLAHSWKLRWWILSKSGDIE
ncbi:MAG: WYL domain-containing protein, partial [Gammaproteobacteria bacterium]|nr:WYL domain-containing protein [Gammaproteobacteria bacterium]